MAYASASLWVDNHKLLAFLRGLIAPSCTLKVGKLAHNTETTVDANNSCMALGTVFPENDGATVY